MGYVISDKADRFAIEIRGGSFGPDGLRVVFGIVNVGKLGGLYPIEVRGELGSTKKLRLLETLMRIAAELHSDDWSIISITKL